MTSTIIPIYTSRGDPEAFIAYPYLFNRGGEWIGFIAADRNVYSVLGYFVGTLTNDPRIIRKRSEEKRPNQKPPKTPPHLRISAILPLPKMMSELTHGIVDVLQDEPERLHTLDSGDLRQDLD